MCVNGSSSTSHTQCPLSHTCAVSVCMQSCCITCHHTVEGARTTNVLYGSGTVMNCILVTANCASLLRWLVCLTCWASARALEPLSCTSTKDLSPSMPSTAVWRECATVHPLIVCQSAIKMQVSGVQHWVSCGVVQLACLLWH